MEKVERLPLINSYIDKWANEKPDCTALIQSEDGKSLSYKALRDMSNLIALRMLSKGIQPGDRVATMLLLTTEHVALMLACFKIGAIFAPLDVRLQDEELVRDLNKIEPKAFFFLGNTPFRDFRQAGQAVRQKCPSVELLVQYSLKEQELLNGAMYISDFLNVDEMAALTEKADLLAHFMEVQKGLNPRTPAVIIYTTGTTGEPKPALLCHENILIQNQILERGLKINSDDLKLLANMPPSHVACVTEGLMTVFYAGGTAVLLRIFDPSASLKAVADYNVTVMAQVPTQYRMEWALPNYNDYDLSSLKYTIYAGAAVDVPFLEQMAKMAESFGTGFGMTENAGFALFTPHGISVEEMAGQVGCAFPDLAPVTIRKPINEDGSAGEILPEGSMGEICYEGGIVFSGYFNQPEETKKVISTDGVLYSGDMGYFKNMGDYDALYLGGRRKFIIKQKGYNVYPDEVAAFLAAYPGVTQAEVVGAKHRIFDEGIVAFVKPAHGVELDQKALMEYCKNIAAYKRPQHIEILPHNFIIPVNRVGKTDIPRMQEIAANVVEKIRKKGGWDSQ